MSAAYSQFESIFNVPLWEKCVISDSNALGSRVSACCRCCVISLCSRTPTHWFNPQFIHIWD